jgi:hypothetical protein
VAALLRADRGEEGPVDPVAAAGLAVEAQARGRDVAFGRVRRHGLCTAATAEAADVATEQRGHRAEQGHDERDPAAACGRDPAAEPAPSAGKLCGRRHQSAPTATTRQPPVPGRMVTAIG